MAEKRANLHRTPMEDFVAAVGKDGFSCIVETGAMVFIPHDFALCTVAGSASVHGLRLVTVGKDAFNLKAQALLKSYADSFPSVKVGGVFDGVWDVLEHALAD